MLLSALVITRNNGKAHSLQPISLIERNMYTKRKNLSISGVPTYFKQHHIYISLKEPIQKEHSVQ